MNRERCCFQGYRFLFADENISGKEEELFKSTLHNSFLIMFIQIKVRIVDDVLGFWQTSANAQLSKFQINYFCVSS